MNLRPILITGSHKSGTTWVGKTLSQSPGIGYIHEPFSPKKNKYKIRKSPIKFWYEYVSINDPIDRIEKFKEYIKNELEYNLIDHLNESILKRPMAMFNRFKDDYLNRIGSRKLIKDPISFFSVEFLYKEFNMDVIILIRHPAAFIESLVNKGWTFNFNNFLLQESLMQEKLNYFRKDIQEIVQTNSRDSIIEQGILLWNIFYREVCMLKEEYKNWIFIRHEDLSTDPKNTFKYLCIRLGINKMDRINKFINKSTNSMVEAKLYRNSKLNKIKWKSKFSGEEVERIYQGTGKIASSFYEKSEW